MPLCLSGRFFVYLVSFLLICLTDRDPRRNNVNIERHRQEYLHEHHDQKNVDQNNQFRIME